MPNVKVTVGRDCCPSVSKVCTTAQNARIFVASALGVPMPLSANVGIAVGQCFEDVAIGAKVTASFGTGGQYPGIYTCTFTRA